jgi:cell division protein FtsQ
VSFARPRVAQRRRALRRPRLHVFRPFRLLAAVISVGLLLFGGWMWLRDSALVAASHVTVTGVTGPDSAAIRSALRGAAHGMTTLDVQESQLRRAVAPFREVKALRVSTGFPHRMLIRVIEQLPVAVLQTGGREIPVAQDGTLLRDKPVSPSLPLISLAVPPVGSRLTEPEGARFVALLAAAPYATLARISQVSTVAGHGPTAQVRGGPSIYFGDMSDLGAKWMAAVQVLGDPSSAGASYIDVSDPARPAAGAPGAGTTGASGAAATGAGTTGAGTPAGGATSATSGG